MYLPWCTVWTIGFASGCAGSSMKRLHKLKIVSKALHLWIGLWRNIDNITISIKHVLFFFFAFAFLFGKKILFEKKEIDPLTEHFSCLWSPLSNKWRQDLGIQFQLERNPPEKQRDVILIEKSIVLWTIAQIEVAWGGGKSGTTKDKVLSQSSANIQTFLINTDGALRPPTTYDNHPIHPTLPIPSVHPQSLFNHLNKPWIDLSRPPMTSYQSTKAIAVKMFERLNGITALHWQDMERIHPISMNKDEKIWTLDD